MESLSKGPKNEVIALASNRLSSNFSELSLIESVFEEAVITHIFSLSDEDKPLCVFATWNLDEDIGAHWLNPIFVASAIDSEKQNCVFDSDRHGYDGIFNGGCCSAQGNKPEPIPCEKCGRFDMQLKVALSYQFELDEIENDWTDAERQQLPDVFDTAEFSGICVTCHHITTIEGFECA